MVDFFNFTNFKNLLELSQKESFFDTVSKWPIFQKSFKQWESKCSILCQEQHGASEKLLVELRASLNLMEWDDNVLEKDNMLISQWDSETRNNTGKDIKKFGSAIELMCLLDQQKEAFVHCLSNHFSSWNQFSIKLVKNVFKIISLNRLFRIKEFEELLHKLWSNIHFEWSDLNSLINDKLQEELIDTLYVWPWWFNLFFLLDTSFRKGQVTSFEIWKRSENVFLNHSHDIIKVRNDQWHHCFLIL